MPPPTTPGGLTEAGSNHGATSSQSTATAYSRSERPDAHTQRYDRQLRLWASSGQRSLESASVLLVGSSHLGACTLKNLILPGIGSFTILDDELVSHADLGNNFFLEEASLGTPRARETVRCLCELNPGVKGEARVEAVRTLLRESPDLFARHTLIIAANQPPDVVAQLSGIAWEANEGNGAPLMLVRGAGFVGECRIQNRELGIIETHPESTIDLRLTSPWPELEQYAQSYNMDTTDSMEHSHIPYVVILLRKLKQWQSEHGSLPKPSVDRKAFLDSLNAGRQKGNADEENFDEAISALGQHVWRPLAAQGKKIPSEIEALLMDEQCLKVHKGSSNFWLLLNALRSFVHANANDLPPGGSGHLPLPGSLPDMKSLSNTYVELQRLYKDKAMRDVHSLKRHLAQTLDKVGLPQDAIADAEVESFAKHAGYLKLVRGRKIVEADAKPNGETLMMAFMDPVNPITVVHHLALRAADRFYAKRGRFPGSSRAFTQSITGGCAGGVGHDATPTSHAGNSAATNDTSAADGGERAAKRPRSNEPEERGASSSSTATANMEVDEDRPSAVATNGSALKDGGGDEEPDVEQDTEELLQELDAVLDACGVQEEEHRDMVRDAGREVVRSGHCDLPSTAALLGGVAAQEAIKLITRQYVPLDNTAVYDGVKQAVGAYRL